MPQINTIQLKDVLQAKRFDAEYFKSEYVEIENKLQNIESDFLFNLADNGYKRFVPKDKDKFFNYIEIANVNLTTGEYESEKTPNDDAPSRAQKVCNQFDILVSTVRPNRNAVAFVLEKTDNLVASSGFCKLSKIKINPYYLFILFKTYQYIALLERATTATQYPAVNENDILNLKIPIFSQQFQARIEKLVKQAHQQLQESKQLYKQAEQLLLQELDLVDYKPKYTLSFEVNKREVDRAGRYDAEYFQPKYKEIIEKIEKYKGGFDVLENIVDWKKGVEVGSDAYTDKGKQFIRVADFSIFGIEDTAKKVSDALFQKLKNDFQPKKGEILFTKDGTIGISSVVREEIEGITSVAFLRLNLKAKYKDFEKECLSLILNSVICKLQAERLSGGAIIEHLKPDDFGKIKIPLIQPDIQKQIADKITRSHQFHQQSKQLLDIAKRAVEVAVEKGEKEGMACINKK